MRHAVLTTAMLLTLVAQGLLAADEPLANIAGPDFGTRIVADTEYAPDYAGAKVADGSLEGGTGCWYSRDQSPLPLALTFEFAQEADVRRVALVQAVWTGNMYHTRDFAVEFSADGQDWQRVATGELPDESAARREVQLPPTRARWLRIVVLSSYNDFQTCGLAEVEIMAAGLPAFGPASLTLNGTLATGLSLPHCGLSLVTPADGPQVAVVERPAELVMALQNEEWVGVSFDAGGLAEPATIVVEVQVEAGPATVWTGVRGGDRKSRELRPGQHEVRFEAGALQDAHTLWLSAHAGGPETLVWWRGLRLEGPNLRLDVPLRLALPRDTSLPSPELPPLRPGMERALIEWDWRMQDGIGTPRNPSTFAEAVSRLLPRGEVLLADLKRRGVSLDSEQRAWQQLRARATAIAEETELATVWRDLHWLKRRIALRNPLADTGPLVFAKQVPGAFSHQLTQYYGRYARPGGGIFVLQEPGRSFRTRSLTAGKLPAGSFQHPEVTFDADRILFSYCQAETPPEDTRNGHAGRFFHLHEVRPDGTGLRQMTDGPHDDFSPRELPDGRLLMVSTRRHGWHRCGSPGCENYTLAVARPDGSEAKPISYHETQEWDPALLNDGRIIYSRWDYVDRNAVFFEQLWTTAPDGARPAIYYGNNTFNPVGIWEPRAVPGSPRVMATAAAHHAMTAGSIILVDVAAGVDGKDPLTRLTPDAVFPEGECLVPPVWFSAAREPRTTPEQERWPGHCYRSPFPLSEDYFLAAYSFDTLVGEPQANPPNMFGLYLVDRFGNKELLYRDLNLASAWPVPLRSRTRPPSLPLPGDGPRPAEGTFVMQNVYASDPPLPAGVIKALRVLQVLPKSTPGIDNPPLGLPRGAPGKQVLGTVPVEADGSAHFRAPAGVPLAFQALDERGQAVQVMRSLTYLQPGEATSCVGCHEPRVAAPLAQRPLAARRAASAIQPAPEGSKPFSYPRVVQPVLDRRCVSCHGAENPAGGIPLTGEPEGHYTCSYNALAPRVPYSDQNSMDSLSRPDQYGARGSGLMKMLLAGHHDVRLSGEDLERLVTWMDANVLFYGTFDPADQTRQQRGEIIEGPKLE